MWTKEGNETPNSFLLCDIQLLRILVVFCPTLVLLTHAAIIYSSAIACQAMVIIELN